METWQERWNRHHAESMHNLRAKKAFHGVPADEFDGVSSAELQQGIAQYNRGWQPAAQAGIASPGSPVLTGQESVAQLQRRDADAQAYANHLLAKPASQLTAEERAWLAQAVRESQG